jgi:hypothetical protein
VLISLGLVLLIAAVSLGKSGPTGSGYQFAVDSSGTGPPPKSPPGQVCKGESKSHVPGEKGTPFSTCIKEAAHGH